MSERSSKSKENIGLSVVVPVYNVEPYLERCLDSILNQVYSVTEIICVDDGSTDKSGEILDNYSQKDARIKVIHKENGGLVSARKEGLRHATGKYATYVDSDDWIEPQMYAQLMNLICENDADIVTSGCIRDYGNNCVEENEHISAGVYEGKQLVKEVLECMIETETFFRSNVSIHIYNKIYKRELLQKFQERVDDTVNIGEDAACVYPCFLNAEKIVVSGKNYYHYCLRMDSLMGNRRKDEPERFRILFENLKREFLMQEKRVKNVRLQYAFFEYYEKLLQQTESVICCEEGRVFPFESFGENERVIIYGAGKFGTILKQVIENLAYGKVVACVDKTPRQGIKEPSFLLEAKYDKIIIAVLLADVVLEIKHELILMGIPEERICCVDHLYLKEKIVN